jgi:hypothetical protein
LARLWTGRDGEAASGVGLPLKQIAVLLAGRWGALDAVLELQEDLLQRQSERLGRALTLVQSARKRLSSGASLSIDDLTRLTLEPIMANIMPKPDEVC